jgi:hypothetical protein
MQSCFLKTVFTTAEKNLIKKYPFIRDFSNDGAQFSIIKQFGSELVIDK